MRIVINKIYVINKHQRTSLIATTPSIQYFSFKFTYVNQHPVELPPNQEPQTDDHFEQWSNLDQESKIEFFRTLPRVDAEELFLSLSASDHALIIETLSPAECRSWLRLLHPDDVADVIQNFPHEDRHRLLAALDSTTRTDVIALLTYAEDEAGGLMNPHFVRLKPEISSDVAIRYLRAQARKQVESIHYAYVIGEDEKLLGTVSFREMLLAPPQKPIHEVMKTDLITIPESMDQEEISKIFSQSGLSALPVIDSEGRMKGMVTLDDVVDVVQEEATEDMQKVGGMEALDAPYLQVTLFEMLKKRAGWLTILFFSEMFTATAMGYYEKQIERAVVLALFIPLIISSGGNSGSQATSLIIRAMALGEVRLKDWWRVFLREVSAGIFLGLILGLIGFSRILLWPSRATTYGEHYMLIGLTVGCSLVGIVLWGTLAGSMLPFVLKRIGFDPASASAPFVATLVDVTGIIIYFTVASIFLGGVLL